MTRPPDHFRGTSGAAQVLMSWLPLGFVLLFYGAAQLINLPIGNDLTPGRQNALGFGLHVVEPARIDRAVFGVLPSTWLQQHLYAGGSRWYDAVLGPVYVSHFVVIPVVTAILWFRARDRFRPWITAVLGMSVAGTVTYVVYPMAPPWMADQLGLIDGVQRISAIGWNELHLGGVADLLERSQGASNPVAAMPSLHAGGAALVLLFFWSAGGVTRRTLLVGYAAAMGFVLIYTGEHYVIDVVAGWIAALIGIGASRTGRVIRRRRDERRAVVTGAVRAGRSTPTHQ